jgi:hypothetical protein
MVATDCLFLSFEERLGLLRKHKLLQREVPKVNRLRKRSKLRLDAQPSLGLTRHLLVQLLTGAYVHLHENILIPGQRDEEKRMLPGPE